MENGEKKPIGPTSKLCFKLDHFTGVRFGLFVYATKEVGGSATFSNFRYETKLDGATDIIVNMSGDIDIISARDAMEYILNITGSEVNVLFGVVGNKEEDGVCGITVICSE